MGRRRSKARLNSKNKASNKPRNKQIAKIESNPIISGETSDLNPNIYPGETSDLNHNNTDTLYGHDANDLIVVYFRYEDIYNDNKYNGRFFPQWFCTDLVNESHGVFIPANKLILCTYTEMASLCIKSMKANKISGAHKKVKFYYYPNVLVVNGQDPYVR